MADGNRAFLVNCSTHRSSGCAPVVHVVTVGDELLAGDIIDRNKAHLAARARAVGLEVRRAITVRDRQGEIAEALRQTAVEADVCLVSGGLGPTTDDLTTAAVAEAAGLPMRRDAGAQARLEEKFRRLGLTMVPANLKQADFPVGAEILANPIGSAEGLGLVLPGSRQCRVFVMPGVPRELERMLGEQVIPRLCQTLALRPVPRRVYRVIGHGESSVADRIAPVLSAARKRSAGLSAMFVHYRASMPQVTVLVEATPGPAGDQARPEELAALDAEMIAVLSPGLYGIGEAELAPRIVETLAAAGLRVATAESCTGGGLGALITGVPGASSVFRGGIIAYDNAIKQSVLGVPAALLEREGAVCESVARAMAEGGRDRLGSDLAVGITGIAGPGGGSADKPVGTVHIAVADHSETIHKALRLRGNRGTVQRATAQWALKILWDRLLARGVASIAARDC